MQFYELAKRRKKKIEEEIALLEKQISNAPEGRLDINRNGNRYKWYVSDSSAGRRYIPKEKESYAAALAKKTYNLRKLSIQKKERDAISVYINKHQANDKLIKRLMQGSEEFSRLVLKGDKDAKFDDKVERWLREEYETNPNHPEHLTIKTVGGLYVRSKSEAYIAAELASHSIPFRYECKHEICGMILYPDFTIMNPLTEDIILWEHLGMVDDENYLNNSFAKIRLYIREGFIPSVNLILTSETKEMPLDFSAIQALIKAYFEV